MPAEQLRRILLKEMGITSWFPRAALPGAALSHEQCLQNFLNDVPADSAPVAGKSAAGPATLDAAVSSGAPREMAIASSAPHNAAAVERKQGANTGVAQLAELLGKKPADSVPVNIELRSDVDPVAGSAGKPAPSALPVRQSATPAAGIQRTELEAFGFSWFNVDKRLAVLTMLPAGNSRLTSSCRQMLARLLAALHTPWQSLELSEQSFHWPFADDLGLPADADAARHAVDGFIARRLREQNCAMLLVLCDGLPWFFQQKTKDTQQPAAGAETTAMLQIHRQFGFAMLATHSLHSMEKDAGLKREAWQSMQLLRERLNRNN